MLHRVYRLIPVTVVFSQYAPNPTRYIDETRPEGVALLPKAAAERALVRELSEIIASGIQPVQNLRVL